MSTDFDQDPPSTNARSMYGVPVRIFVPDDIRGVVAHADEPVLDVVGQLQLAHDERPMHRDRMGLD